MIYDLSDFLASNEVQLHLEGSLDSNDSTFDLQGLDIKFPVFYDINIYKVEKDLQVDLEVEYTLHTQCDRCLKEIDVPLYSQTALELTADQTHIQEAAVEESSDETIKVEELSKFPLTDLVISQIITSIPTKILCDDACKGLCSQCGADLNEGLCDCEDDISFNQFAVLNDLFQDDKEV